MRRHLIMTFAIAIALTVTLSAPIGSGPAPVCAKQQFEQPEKTHDGDPEYFDGGQKPGGVSSQVVDLPTERATQKPARSVNKLFRLLRIFFLVHRGPVW
jgi:hypothetical protein